jgi:hypothetical protein
MAVPTMTLRGGTPDVVLIVKPAARAGIETALPAARPPIDVRKPLRFTVTSPVLLTTVPHGAADTVRSWLPKTVVNSALEFGRKLTYPSSNGYFLLS